MNEKCQNYNACKYEMVRAENVSCLQIDKQEPCLLFPSSLLTFDCSRLQATKYWYVIRYFSTVYACYWNNTYALHLIVPGFKPLNTSMSVDIFPLCVIGKTSRNSKFTLTHTAYCTVLD